MDEVCGGWSETKDVPEILKICDEVKRSVEEKTDKKYVEFKAVYYREQIVAGTNYLIKVHVGGEYYIHLLVFWALPCHGGGIKLRCLQEHKTKDDPLKPFSC